MPIDLMSLVEGGAQTPGKRPSGSGKLFANKELMAQFENKAEPEKPPEPLRTTSKKWTPPPKPESEYQKAAQANEGRMPWDPPVRQRSWEQKSAAAPTSPAPKIVADAPGKPAPVIFARASEPSGKDGGESPKSRISDNPFMRRDSKEGMSPRSPVQRPTDAYPVISTIERAEPVKPSPEKVAEWAAVQQKAEAPTRIGEATPPEAEAEAPTPAAKPQPATAPTPEPAPAPEPVPAAEPVPVPEPAAAAEEKAAEEKAAGEKAAAETAAAEKAVAEEAASEKAAAERAAAASKEAAARAAVAEPPQPEPLGKEGKKKSSMGSLFAALSPRGRRGSKDK